MMTSCEDPALKRYICHTVSASWPSISRAVHCPRHNQSSTVLGWWKAFYGLRALDTTALLDVLVQTWLTGVLQATTLVRSEFARRKLVNAGIEVMCVN